MNKKEKEVFARVKKCIDFMSTLMPPNQAHLKAKLKNHYILVEVSKKIRSAMEEVEWYGEYEIAVEKLDKAYKWMKEEADKYVGEPLEL